MTDFVIPPPVPPSLAIAGSSRRFALRRVFCVGRNDAEHARTYFDHFKELTKNEG